MESMGLPALEPQTGGVPLTVPKGVDQHWQEKIEQARQARELMAKLREGKPQSFRMAVGRVP